MLGVMYVFYVHRQVSRWRLVLRDGDAFPDVTTAEQWQRTRIRTAADTNVDVRDDIASRGYCLFAITATFEDLNRDISTHGKRKERQPLASLAIRGRRFDLMQATEHDVPELVQLLADDALGADRESDDLVPYLKAFRQIDAITGHLLLTVRDDSAKMVGTIQLTLLPSLARQGALRLHIEAVRIVGGARGIGLGSALFTWAHEYGRQQGATVAQLTSDKSRTNAHRFYERLGYNPSHVGYKYWL
ncbi:acetyltransferase (GNAT) family protein [Antricoccus suffuscus]|uniref:Acetyltransferase (GNAT) family protein n=1 Tax=Antricoccus suffuscus TaxID=1629062 RepID=A0A2T1A2B7_9ACTN|nr:GNAT family N-acetyltransferase [Antricoccus suffuscus]PRZ42674.1 acetyltransferase (GNAT) family protein [Antricoccus suffuscus]